MPSPKAKPFNKISVDIFEVNQINYWTIICQHSGWLCLFPIKKDDPLQVIFIFRRYFSQYGIACTMFTDKGSVFSIQQMDDFLLSYDIRHEYSSYLPLRPRSSQQHKLIGKMYTKAEQRHVLANLSDDNSLDQDRLEHALFLHRNTPDAIETIYLKIQGEGM